MTPVKAAAVSFWTTKNTLSSFVPERPGKFRGTVRKLLRIPLRALVPCRYNHYNPPDARARQRELNH